MVPGQMSAWDNGDGDGAGRTVNATRTFFDLSWVTKLWLKTNCKSGRDKHTKTTSSKLKASRMSVCGGGGGLMLDLIPDFWVTLERRMVVS